MLSNAEKRNMYDQVGKQGLNGAGVPGGGGAAFSRDQAEAIFAQMFGGQDPFAGLFAEMGGGRGRGGMRGGPQVQFQFGGEYLKQRTLCARAPACHLSRHPKDGQLSRPQCTPFPSRGALRQLTPRYLVSRRYARRNGRRYARRNGRNAGGHA